MNKREQIKEIAYTTWVRCANAFRLYPDNRHTFGEFWRDSESEFDQYNAPDKEFDRYEMEEFAYHIKNLKPVDMITVHGDSGVRDLTFAELFDNWNRKRKRV